MYQSVNWRRMRIFLTGVRDRSLCYEGRRGHAFTVAESFRPLTSSDQASSPFDLVIMLEARTEDHCDSCFNREDVIGYPGDADLFT